jgi:predicted HD superfamily hydrolase involved in NAD metabolism
MNSLNQDINEIILFVKNSVSTKRFHHIEGVVQTALSLAAEFGVDHQKAELAAWLHDVAKETKQDKLLQIAQENSLELDEVDIMNPHLLHGRIGALIARNKFNIQDTEILKAISNHTLGHPRMSLLEEVIFIADAIEPSRPYEWSDPIKRALQTNSLRGAIVKACQMTILEVASSNRVIHPQMIATYNFYLEGFRFT